MLSRPRALALVTLALLNVFTIAAGVTLADLLRARRPLAEPRVAVRPVVRGAAVLAPGQRVRPAADPRRARRGAVAAAVVSRARPERGRGGHRPGVRARPFQQRRHVSR